MRKLPLYTFFRQSFTKLRSRLMAAFVLLATIPLLLSALFFGYYSYHFYYDITTGYAQNNVSMIGERIDDSLSMHADTLISVITNLDVTRMVQEYDSADQYRKWQITSALRDRLYSAQANLGDVYSFEIFSTTQRIGFSSNRITAPELSNSSIIRNTQTNDTLLSWFPTQMFEEKNTISHGIVLTGKITDFNTQKTVGYVVMGINADYYNRMLHNNNEKTYDSIYITDENGLILANSDKNMVMSYQDTRITQSLDSMHPVNLVIGDTAVYTVPVNHGQWFAIAAIDTRAALAPIHTVYIAIIIFAIILMILAGIVSYSLSESVSRPIKRMTQTMESVRDLSLPYTSQPTNNYEINCLATAFEQLVNRTRRLIEENYRNRIRRMQAEFDTLQAQIKPHFLYNTLDTIYWRAYQNKEHDICHMVNSLSNFFKLSLNSGCEYHTVSDELKLVESYVDIQSTRYKNQISVTYEIDEDLKELYCLRLLLQPLVENSMVHGFMRGELKGNIIVCVYIRQNMLHMEVLDDGTGFKSLPALDNPSRSSDRSGYGLYNIHQRIRLYYGNGFGCYCYNCTAGGAAVGITLPVIQNEEGIPFEANPSAVS